MYGVTPSLCFLGVAFLAWSAEGPGDSAGWGKDVGGNHVAIEEKESKERRVDSVSRGEDDMLN